MTYTGAQKTTQTRQAVFMGHRTQARAHLWKKFSLQHLSIWELQLYLSMCGKRVAAIVHITINTIGGWKSDLYYWRQKVH